MGISPIFVGILWVYFIPVDVIPEIGVCGGGAHPYFRNFSARLKHVRMLCYLAAIIFSQSIKSKTVDLGQDESQVGCLMVSFSGRC